METYHKIQTLFKRHQDGPKKGKMIRGDWSRPELEYLAGNQWEFTEKVDGTNIRIQLVRASRDGLFNYEIRGRTDNAVLPRPLMESLSDMLDSNAKIAAWFVDNPELKEVLLFGEGYGPKIQNGGNYREDQSFVLFDVKIGEWWLERNNVNDVGEKLGFDVVPVIGQGTLQDAVSIVKGQDPSYGLINGGLASQWGDFEAEGIVARPTVTLFNRKGERIITKIKAVDFR